MHDGSVASNQQPATRVALEGRRGERLHRRSAVELNIEQPVSPRTCRHRQQVALPYEGRDIDGIGLLEDFLRGADLIDPPAPKHHHPVGHRQRFGLVVGHVDERHAERAVELGELDAHFVAEFRIEVGKRLVQQQHLGRVAMARASAIRCCWPPESSLGRR